VRWEYDTAMHNILRLIHQLAVQTPRPLTTDQQLLHRFFLDHDERAFTEILERHGPMVYSVCLRVLAHRQDAEDAFQATFLTLVRKGQTIRRSAALPIWLHRVAFRLAVTQRNRLHRHPVEPLLKDVADDLPTDEAGKELRDALDFEVQRLPAKYRKVLVLCGLQGKSYDEAAREIGCPKGTVAIRLLRGRRILKNRLVRRGLLSAAGGVAAGGALSPALAAMSPPLAATTATAAAAVASGAALASVVSLSVVTLINAAARDVWVGKCKGVAVVLALMGLTGSGASVAAQVQYQAASGAQSMGHPPRPIPPPGGIVTVRTQQSFPDGVNHSADGKTIINWQPATITPEYKAYHAARAIAGLPR